MVKKTRLGKDALVSAVMTLTTVLVWIGFSVHHAFTKTTITKIAQEQMKPLNPQIKREIIEKLKTNLSLTDEELNTIPLMTETEENEETELETNEAATRSAISQPTTTSEKEDSSS